MGWVFCRVIFIRHGHWIFVQTFLATKMKIGESETTISSKRKGKLLVALKTYRTLRKKNRNAKQVAAMMHNMFDERTITEVKKFLKPKRSILY
jgi:hypothetical protein